MWLFELRQFDLWLMTCGCSSYRCSIPPVFLNCSFSNYSLCHFSFSYVLSSVVHPVAVFL